MKRLPLITSIVICLGAIATIVLNVVSCCRRAAEPPPSAPAPSEPAPVLSAEERNLSKAQERAADEEYMAVLHDLGRAQASLASARAQAVGAFSKWYGGWCVSNEAARALLEKAARPDVGTNELSALKAELEALVRADPVGAALRARIDEAETAVSNHQNVVRGVIGARLRRQTEEHAAEELAAEKAHREAWLRDHPEAVATSAPPGTATMSVTNLFAGRETVWTNGVKVIRATVTPASTNAPAREGPASSGPPSREGPALSGPPSREGPASSGPPSREGPASSAPSPAKTP